MSDDDEYPSAEALAQHERNQHDPAWLEWLAGMDDALRIFFTEDVPDLPADPYTAAGLSHAEQTALKYFRNSSSPDLPHHRERADRFQRYVGETYVRNFEGCWVNVNDSGDPAVDLTCLSEYLLPAQQLRSALWLARTGESWPTVFTNVADMYTDWVENGRMPTQEWSDFRVDRRTRGKEPSRVTITNSPTGHGSPCRGSTLTEPDPIFSGGPNMTDTERPAPTEIARKEAEQRDPAWLDWLAGMEDGLQVFFTEDVPDMPADPYSEAGLRHAEQAALKYFPTALSARRPANKERADRFCRYLGETFVRNLEGKWRNVVKEDGTRSAAVDVPGFIYVYVMELLESAIWQERNGEAWSSVFAGASEYHTDWAENGRLPAQEWHEIRAERNVAKFDKDDRVSGD